MSILQRRLVRVAAAAVAVVGWGAQTPAQSALIGADLFNPGDQLLTRDTDTGLEWLDLNQTLNLSINEIVAGADGWSAMGFEHATRSQVKDLYVHFGIPTLSGQFVPENVPSVTTVILTLGCTGQCGSDPNVVPLFAFSQGFVIVNSTTGAEPSVQIGLNTGGINDPTIAALANPDGGFVSRDLRLVPVGNYLIRISPVPLPAALPLFLSALAGLGLMGWRRRQADG